MLKRFTDRTHFASDHEGSCLIGDGWIYWCHSSELYGFSAWGRLTVESAKQLVQAFRLELDLPAEPHRSLLDVSRVDSIEMGAYQVLHQYVQEESARLLEHISKAALVRPGGMPGAIAEGFFRVVDAPHPVSVFRDRREALQFLVAWNTKELQQSLETITHQAMGTDPLVSTLRSYLRQNLQNPEIGAASKALTLSRRTLQRRLRASGTTFVEEVRESRISVAKQLLRDTDQPLIQVAVDVGFSTAQAFSSAFRREVGVSPSAFRTNEITGADEAPKSRTQGRGKPRASSPKIVAS